MCCLSKLEHIVAWPISKKRIKTQSKVSIKADSDCLGIKNQLIIIHLSPASATVTVLVQSNNDDNTRNYDSNTYLYLRLHHGNKILDWNDGQHLIHLLHPGSSLTSKYSGTKWLWCIYYYITYLSHPYNKYKLYISLYMSTVKLFYQYH